MKKSSISSKDVKKLTLSEMRSELPALVKRANTRLKRLTESGVDYYAAGRAIRYLGGRETGRFSGKTKGLTKQQIERELYEVAKFLESESSTKTGLEAIRQRQINRVADRLKVDKNKEELLKQFLYSKEFQTAKKYGDSETILRDYVEQLDTMQNAEEVINAFEAFMQLDVSDEEYNNLLANAQNIRS